MISIHSVIITENFYSSVFSYKICRCLVVRGYESRIYDIPKEFLLQFYLQLDVSSIKTVIQQDDDWDTTRTILVGIMGVYF